MPGTNLVGHQSGGRRDSLFAAFARNADDDTIPVIVQPNKDGAALTGLDVVKALFGSAVAGLPDNNDTTPVPARGNVMGSTGATLTDGTDSRISCPIMVRRLAAARLTPMFTSSERASSSISFRVMPSSVLTSWSTSGAPAPP